MKRTGNAPRCVVIAGPNGAGKTTFAREFLPYEAKIVHFVNADLIFQNTYRLLADSWAIYDNTGEKLVQVEIGP
jgi:predicted ABC-type ATPase